MYNFLIECNFLYLELALKILFADDNGILCFAKSIINLDSINFKIITADILFLFLQLIESFPTFIVYYIKLIMVNEIQLSVNFQHIMYQC